MLNFSRLRKPLKKAADPGNHYTVCNKTKYLGSYGQRHGKFQKKLMSQFQENLQTDRQTDGKTDPTIGPFSPRHPSWGPTRGETIKF